jgi:hypothetical protein
MGIRVLCLDFDGVLHSYVSGWKGVSVISDPPVAGAIQWLRSLLTDVDKVCSMAPRYLDFDVQIYSARSRSWRGRRAMRKWLGEQFEKAGYYRDLVELIKFPRRKPAAWLTIDDRAMRFDGRFPSVDEIKSFVPWYREEKRNEG